MALGDAVKRGGEHLQLAGHASLQYLAAAFVNNLRWLLRVAGCRVVEVAQLRKTFAVNLHAADDVHQIVAGRAGNSPIGRQRLVAGQDLFGNDINLRCRRLVIRGRCER